MIRWGRATAALLAITAAVWMGACGGEEAGADSATLGLSGGSPEDTQKALCSRFAKDLCAARSKCCTDLPPDGVFSCEQSADIDCTLSTGSQLHEGWVFSGERIDAMLGRLQAAAANCSAYRLPDDLDPFAPQEVALGGSCTQFSTSKPCAGDLGCFESNCEVRLAEGASCSTGALSQCAVGLYCGTGVCRPVGEAGGECLSSGRGTDGGCVPGLYCVPTDTNPRTSGKVCAPQRAAGETCSEDTDCASRNCTGSTCVVCTTDASCNVAGGRCNAGVCSTVFDFCGAYSRPYSD